VQQLTVQQSSGQHFPVQQASFGIDQHIGGMGVTGDFINKGSGL
jgi:hypothetical protein